MPTEEKILLQECHPQASLSCELLLKCEFLVSRIFRMSVFFFCFFFPSKYLKALSPTSNLNFILFVNCNFFFLTYNQKLESSILNKNMNIYWTDTFFFFTRKILYIIWQNFLLLFSILIFYFWIYNCKFL